MKFLTLLFCAATLTASSAYGMKAPGTTPKAPKTERSWKSHLASGVGKLTGLILPALAFYCHRENALDFDGARNYVYKRNGMLYFWGGVATFAVVSHWSYASLKKAYSSYAKTKKEAL